MFDENNGYGGGENDAQPLELQQGEPNPERSSAMPDRDEQQGAYAQSDDQQSVYAYAQPDEQQGTYAQQDPYRQSDFTQSTYDKTSEYEKKPEGGVGFGIAALVLGILSMCTFCTICINLPLAALSVVFAILQLVRGNGKGLAIGGLITAVFSILACFIFWLVIGAQSAGFAIDRRIDQMAPYSDDTYDNYDYDYDYDFDDDTL